METTPAPKTNDYIIITSGDHKGWEGIITRFIPTQYRERQVEIKLATAPGYTLVSESQVKILKAGEMEGQASLF
jgi:hypothetical protein